MGCSTVYQEKVFSTVLYYINSDGDITSLVFCLKLCPSG